MGLSVSKLLCVGVLCTVNFSCKEQVASTGGQTQSSSAAVPQNSSAPSYDLKEYANTKWALVQDGNIFSVEFGEVGARINVNTEDEDTKIEATKFEIIQPQPNEKGYITFSAKDNNMFLSLIIESKDCLLMPDNDAPAGCLRKVNTLPATRIAAVPDVGNAPGMDNNRPAIDPKILNDLKQYYAGFYDLQKGSAKCSPNLYIGVNNGGTGNISVTDDYTLMNAPLGQVNRGKYNPEKYGGFLKGGATLSFDQLNYFRLDFKASGRSPIGESGWHIIPSAMSLRLEIKDYQNNIDTINLEYNKFGIASFYKRCTYKKRK